MAYARASSSLAHTYGNVTSLVTEFVKNLFNKNYFKTIHISSAIGYKQFNVFQNTNKEFLKKNKPMLIIRPRIDINNSDTFLYGTYFTQRITDNYSDLDFGNLQEFIIDKKNNRYMKYLLNRMQIFFDVTMIFESQMEQINQAMYIKNTIRQDHCFYIPVALESQLPRELLKVISQDSKVPMYDSNGSVKPFLDYLNGNTVDPVTYKMKNSTGRDEFFRFYQTNMDTTFTGLTVDDGTKKGFVSDSYTVSFTINTEFYMAGLYYYFTTNNDVIQEVDMSMLLDDKSIIPIFTVSNLFSNPLPEGWNLYTSPMYKVDFDRRPDQMDISSLFGEGLKNVIKYHLKHGIPLDTFIQSFVLKDNSMLDATKGEYSIDYDKMILTTNNTNKVSTYRLIINVNTLYINNLTSDIYNISEEK